MPSHRGSHKTPAAGIGGIPLAWYCTAWWTVAVWNAAFVFNVLARTQQFGFAFPLAPDFGNAATPYAVAAVGGMGGAVLLSIVAVGYAMHAGRTADGWPRRIPTVANEIDPATGGTLVVLVRVLILLLTLAFPAAMQVHFVDKYLSGTSTYLDGRLYANSWTGHLLTWPAHPCHDFAYDGKPSAAYCEFYEPWAVVICAIISIGFTFLALRSVFLRHGRGVI